jgi:uncharacterized FlaG/YvyC family protein
MEIKNNKVSSTYSKAREAEAKAEAENMNAKLAVKQAEALKASPPVLASQEVSYAIDNDDNVIIRIVDKKTGKVVKQLPPEEYLEMSDKLKRISGQIFHVEV